MLRSAVRNLWRNLKDIARSDPIRLIAAVVATILTVVGILVKDTLTAVLGILVVLDLLAVSQLTAGSATLSLNRRAQETGEAVQRIEATSTDTHGRVERIEGASLETRDLVRKFDVEMLNEARSVGIIDMFARRKLDERARLAVLSELQKVRASRGKVDLLGVALPDYFLRPPFVDYMTEFVSGAGFRALILHPESKAAEHRARIERGTALTIVDVKASREEIRGFLEDNRRVQGRLYSITPTMFLMISDDYVFLEQYHLARLGRRVQCIGGHVPFLQIAPVALPFGEFDTYTIMKRHFDELWNNSEKIEIRLAIEFRCRDGRHSLTLRRPIPPEREEDHSDWTLDQPLNLSDWTLKRDHAADSEIYSFLPGTLLEPQGSLEILEGSGIDADDQKYTDDDLWEEGDNLVLRNAIGSRTATFRIVYA